MWNSIVYEVPSSTLQFLDDRTASYVLNTKSKLNSILFLTDICSEILSGDDSEILAEITSSDLGRLSQWTRR